MLSNLIDVHAHSMLPPWIAMLRRRDPDGRAIVEGWPVPEWSPRAALEIMDQHGIEIMMLSNPTGTDRVDPVEAATLARQMNEQMAAIVSAHPSRFGAFAVLPLGDIDATLREIEYALDDLGLDGICLQTNVGGDYLGSKRFVPLFAELDRRRATAFVHPISPSFISEINLPFNQSLLEFMAETTRAIASIVLSGTRRQFPNFNYIATHGGGTAPYLAQRLETSVRPGPNGYGIHISGAEIRQGLASLMFDLTAATGRGGMQCLLDLVPPSQLLLGFDYPMRPASLIAPALDSFVGSKLFDPEQLRDIASRNALRIFPSVAARRLP